MRSTLLKTLMVAGVLCLLVGMAGPARAGLISLYQFEGDLTDAKGTFDGTAIGAPAFVADGPPGMGQALLLDGGAGVNCGNVMSPTGSLDVSYAIWVKTISSTGTFGVILSKIDPKNPPDVNPPSGYCLMPRGGGENNSFLGRMGAWQTYGGWGSELRSENNAYGAYWSHVVFTYSHETDEATFYINGELSATMTGIQGRGVAGAANTVHNLFLGQGTPSGWNGLVDEVAVWDNVLTAEEAKDIYKNGIDPFDPEISPENGETIITQNPLTLSWKNRPPIDANNLTTVDVYFGTDPCNLGEPIAADQAITSIDVNASDVGTYYWKVDSYIGEPNAVEGKLWSFTTVDDPAPVINSLTPDQITWSGGGVPLTVDITNLGPSATIFEWVADPAYGFTIIGADTATPTVTITKEPYSNARIPNAGFEAPIMADGASSWTAPTGWSGNACGPWNPGLAGTGWAAFGGAAPEGENVLFVNNGGVASTVLGETIQAGVTYILSVDVGLNADYGANARYKVQLLAGAGEDAAVVAEDDNSLNIALGTFETSTIAFTCDPVEDANKVGLPLKISLLCTSTEDPGSDVEFDNVALTADQMFPASSGVETITMTVYVSDFENPEPSTASMEIDVYDSACHMARAFEGKDNPGDLNKDCSVDVDDLALMAVTWLNTDKELDESVVNSSSITPADAFSVNFYYYPWPWTTTEQFETITLEPGQSAGFDTWQTDSWLNYNVPWAPTAPQNPVTLTSRAGSEATFQLYDCRNGGAYIWDAPRTTLLGDANADLMDGHVNSTLEDTANPDKIFDMEMKDIPFDHYDVIFYMGGSQAQFYDGKGKIVFNGVETAYTLINGFDGTFTEIVDETTPGNYIVFEGLSDPNFSVQTWGTSQNGFAHLGPCGFQVREVNDPNAPEVSAGDSWITWEGQPVSLTGTVDGTGSDWDMGDRAYSWATNLDDDPKLDIAISNPGDLDTMVTVTKVPYLKPFLPNGSFEIVTTQGGQAVQSYRDFWGQYDRPAGATKSARQYVPNPNYHFPEGTNPDGAIICRANSATDESRPDGPAMLLSDVAYDPTATYELSVAVGHPQEINDPTTNNYTDANWRGYLVQLVVGGQAESTGSGPDNIYGGTVVAEDANSIDIPRREWRTSVITLDPSPELADLAGQPIQIRLLTPDDPDPLYATQTKVFFDNVVLKINGEPGTFVTDPGIPRVDMTLTVEEVSTGRTAKGYATIDVYDNACNAGLASNPDMDFDLGDLNGNCITNLEDFTQLAAAWLVDYASTGPADQPEEE